MSRKKVYLPKWQRWFITPVFVGIWLFITYMEFFKSPESEKLGIIGYLFLSFVFLLLAVMIWLMTSGKLPAYYIEDDNDSK